MSLEAANVHLQRALADCEKKLEHNKKNYEAIHNADEKLHERYIAQLQRLEHLLATTGGRRRRKRRRKSRKKRRKTKRRRRRKRRRTRRKRK